MKLSLIVEYSFNHIRLKSCDSITGIDIQALQAWADIADEDKY